MRGCRREAGPSDVFCPIDRSDVDLNVAQADAASRFAGDEQLVLIVGPAGTGKTTALRPAVAQLRADGRPVFGVAPSAGGAEVLEGETGVVSDTLDKLLIEHRLDRPPDHRYDLPAGTTLIVDEAGMSSTPKLAEIAALADRKQWRIVLVGDPMQFSAVGRGGMFGLLVDTYDAVELDRVHPFDHEWERAATLAARDRINEPDRRQRRDHILRQWRGSPGTSGPHRAADPGNRDSTREILRSWQGAPGDRIAEPTGYWQRRSSSAARRTTSGRRAVVAISRPGPLATRLKPRVVAEA